MISGVRLSRHYVPDMVKQGWGRVIFLSSESGVATPADMINYGVTKSANLAVSHGLAKRLAGTGVTVNAILPGPTFTDGLKRCSRTPPPNPGAALREEADAFVLKARPTSIIQRVADVEEVAQSGDLHCFAAVLGHHRRGIARRWRCGRQPGDLNFLRETFIYGNCISNHRYPGFGRSGLAIDRRLQHAAGLAAVYSQK